MPFVSKLSKERFIHLYEEECLAVLQYEDITIKLTPYFNFKPDGSSHLDLRPLDMSVFFYFIGV